MAAVFRRRLMIFIWLQKILSWVLKLKIIWKYQRMSINWWIQSILNRIKSLDLSTETPISQWITKTTTLKSPIQQERTSLTLLDCFKAKSSLRKSNKLKRLQKTKKVSRYLRIDLLAFSSKKNKSREVNIESLFPLSCPKNCLAPLNLSEIKAANSWLPTPLRYISTNLRNS